MKNKLVGHLSPTDYEALAILNGLEVARLKGWPKIIIKSNCLQVINIHLSLLTELF